MVGYHGRVLLPVTDSTAPLRLGNPSVKLPPSRAHEVPVEEKQYLLTARSIPKPVWTEVLQYLPVNGMRGWLVSAAPGSIVNSAVRRMAIIVSGSEDRRFSSDFIKSF